LFHSGKEQKNEKKAKEKTDKVFRRINIFYIKNVKRYLPLKITAGKFGYYEFSQYF
jgi:hypothetical protein